MAVDIKLKRSHTHSNIPSTSDLTEGEFAVNTYDRKMYMRDGSSNIVTVANHYATDFESTTKVLYVTVATKDANHPYNGVGSGNGYKINGVFSPYLHLIPRNTYRFDQSDSSNSGHPLRFYLDSSKTTAYTTGVTTSGTPGSSGAYTQIVVSDATPPVLHYQCSAHGNMGWAVFNNTRNLTNFDTDDLSEGSSNLYFTNARADARISAATTDDLSEGSSNLYHTTARVQAISINNVSEDSTPQLGGSLDLNSNNITGTGNISTTGNITLTSTDAGSSAAPIIELNRDSSSPADADYLGQIKFKGDDDGGSSHVYAKITGKIQDASAGTEDGLIEFANVKAGTQTITARLRSDSLQLLNSTGLTVAGNTTLSGTLNGHTIPGGHGTLALTSDIGSTDLSADSTPQLGGDLDVVTHSIVSTTNRDINITPNGSGKVVLDGISYPTSDGSANHVITTDGSGTLSFASVGSLAGSGIPSVADDTTPQLGGNLDVVTHSIVSTTNRNINITPNGSGKVVLDGISYPSSDGSNGQVLTTNGSGVLSFADASSGSGENVSWSVTQSSHGLAVGDVIYNNGTNYVKAQANATGTLGIFVVSAVANTNTFTATFSGKITLSSLTAGQYYFVSTTSAGDFTATEPTTGYSNPILFALSTTEAVVLPYRPSDLGSASATSIRTNLDVFSKSETNAQISAFAIALGG